MGSVVCLFLFFFFFCGFREGMGGIGAAVLTAAIVALWFPCVCAIERWFQMADSLICVFLLGFIFLSYVSRATENAV